MQCSSWHPFTFGAVILDTRTPFLIPLLRILLSARKLFISKGMAAETIPKFYSIVFFSNRMLFVLFKTGIFYEFTFE